MEDIMKKRISESISKNVKVVLNNNYVYSGKITNADDSYLEILDSKTGSYRLMRLDNIKDCEVMQ